MKRNFLKLFSAQIIILLGLLQAFTQTTEFSYQGFLEDNNASANGNFDFEFRYYDVATGGTPLGTPQQRLNVEVRNGVFSVVLNFGPIPLSTSGPNDFYLETAVRPTGGGIFTTLSPRSKLLSTPFAAIANYSLDANNANNATNATNATTAQNALQLGGVAANQFVQTNDPRLSDDRNPLPGSTNYIQNSTQTTPGNFNITGYGIANALNGNIISANTQFNIGNNRILSNAGSNNLFIGVNTGDVNTGSFNAFVGRGAGQSNTTGFGNSFYGALAGSSNTTGSVNSFFGRDAGDANTTGGSNSFFGSSSGLVNTSGTFNAFFGSNSGLRNSFGDSNSFFGTGSGNTNTIGDNNTLIGYSANVGSSNLNNASAFGSRAFVELSNSLVLGSINGKNGATSDTKVGIGTTTPGAGLDIEGQFPAASPNTANLRITNYGRQPLIRARTSNGTRDTPTRTLLNDVLFSLAVDGHIGSGFTDGGAATMQIYATENWNANANGSAFRFFTTPNGGTVDVLRMTIDQSGNVGIGTTNPAQLLDVNGNIRVGTGTTGCVEDSDGTVIAGTCSSDLRFKKDIKPFGNILNNFAKLRPVNYYWRSDEFKDRSFGTRQSYGLIAQDVEAIFPELVATDEQGYKMVNYSKLPFYTIQAVKELKTENDELKLRIEEQKKQFDLQQKQIEEQQKQIEALKKFVYQNQSKSSKSKKGRN